MTREQILDQQQKREDEQGIVKQRIEFGNRQERNKFRPIPMLNVSTERFAEARKRGNKASRKNAN